MVIPNLIALLCYVAFHLSPVGAHSISSCACKMCFYKRLKATESANKQAHEITKDIYSIGKYVSGEIL